MKKIILRRFVSLILTLGLMITSISVMGELVEAAVQPKKITLSARSKSLYQGEKFELKVKKATPAKASKSVKWESSKRSVASVSSKGVVTAKKAGTTKIKAISSVNRRIKATCTITVKNGTKNKSITLNKTTVSLKVNGYISLKITKWNPSNTKVKKITWTTSDNKIATVTQTGTVKAIAVGTARITATNTYGKKASCTVTVTQPTDILPTNTPTPTATQEQTPLPTESVQPTPLPGEDIYYKTPTNFASKREGVTYGEMELKEYWSDTTQAFRKCNILLPPNYSEGKKYPILYLLHGIGGTHDEWLEYKGLVSNPPRYIIGNLIHDGEAEEMIVVIPNARAMTNDSAPSNIFSNENVEAFANFINDLENDLMPFIEKRYSVSTKWEDTAIAGLSMGGREALSIGLKRVDRFGYIGAFSPAPSLLTTAIQFQDQFLAKDFTVPSGKKPPLIMLCVGTEDGTSGTDTKTYHDTLLNNGVQHLWYTMPGGHDMSVWKNGLYQFAKRIFKI